MLRKLFSCLFFYFTTTYTFAACYSTGNGNWNNTATWLCNGVNAVPGCGDTIYIQTGHVVTVTNQNNYFGIPGCAPMHIVVYGTLQFTNGNKLDLPCGSSVTIPVGGLVQKSGSGGGSSTLIGICGVNVWTAGDGPQPGPISWGGPPLPISLVSFTADLKETTVLLNWITASEQNNNYFTIERSNNTIVWEQIGTMKGAGNSSTTLNYSFLDKNPFSGISYYRLKQTDFDGKSDISDIVSVNNFNIELISVFPNPADDNITFLLMSKEEMTCTINIFNALGQVVESYNLNIKKGENKIRHSVNKLSSGVNLIGISLNGKFVAKKQFLVGQ
ncbi:MAG: T9SS type A sorting domain-containing protein [Flavobacteriales bacterium]|nr:T9SS type A sorting domain-containing protein [Flavobacteriales bacterium]